MLRGDGRPQGTPSPSSIGGLRWRPTEPMQWLAMVASLSLPYSIRLGEQPSRTRPTHGLCFVGFEHESSVCPGPSSAQARLGFISVDATAFRIGHPTPLGLTRIHPSSRHPDCRTASPRLSSGLFFLKEPVILKPRRAPLDRPGSQSPGGKACPPDSRGISCFAF